MDLNNKLGGTYGSCTRLRGFADRCVTAPPTRHLESILIEVPLHYIKRSALFGRIFQIAHLKKLLESVQFLIHRI
jgi:hypothetical protein